jgi:hypothetical protein
MTGQRLGPPVKLARVPCKACRRVVAISYGGWCLSCLIRATRTLKEMAGPVGDFLVSRGQLKPGDRMPLGEELRARLDGKAKVSTAENHALLPGPGAENPRVHVGEAEEVVAIPTVVVRPLHQREDDSGQETGPGPDTGTGFSGADERGPAYPPGSGPAAGLESGR